MENNGIEVRGLLSGIRTDGRTGAFKLSIDVPPDQAIHVMAAMSMYMHNIKLNITDVEDTEG